MSGIAEIREEKINNNQNIPKAGLSFNDASYVFAVSKEDSNKKYYAIINNSHKWDIYLGDKISGFQVFNGDKAKDPVHKGLITTKMVEKMDELSVETQNSGNNPTENNNFYRVKENSMNIK